VLGATLALVASPAVRPSLARLAGTLNDHAERMAEARYTRDRHPTSEQVEVDKTREAVIDVYVDLRRTMFDDFGTR